MQGRTPLNLSMSCNGRYEIKRKSNGKSTPAHNENVVLSHTLNFELGRNINEH